MTEHTNDIAAPLEALDTDAGRPRPIPAPGSNFDLDRDERMALGKRLADLWRVCVEARPEDTRDDPGDATNPGLAYDWREYNMGLDMTPKPFPIRGPNGEPLSANFLLPALHTTVNALMAQWMSAVYDNNPLFLAEPPDEATADAAERAERYLDWLCDHHIRFAESDRRTVERMALEGVGIKHWRWETDGERRYDRGKDAIVEVDDASEGPRCEVVPRDRFHMWPITATDPDKAAYVFLRREAPVADLQRDREGTEPVYVFDDEDWDRVRRAAAPQDEADAKPEVRDRDAEAPDRMVRVVDVYGVYDNDGEPVDCLFSFLPDHGDIVIRATPSKLGSTRPFSFHYAYDAGDDFVGKSVPQIIRGINAGFHQFVLQAANGATLEHLLNQTGLVDADADVQILLGRLDNIVRNPNGFKFIDYRASAANFVMIQLFEHQLQRATGLNDNVLGAYAPSQVTATETRAALGAGSLQFEHSIRLRAQGLKRDAAVISRLISAYAPDQIDFWTPLSDTEIQRRKREERERSEDFRSRMAEFWGVSPDDLPQADIQEPPRLELQKVKASDFENVNWNVAGSVPGLDKQGKVQEALLLLQTLAPMEQDHPERVWQYKARLLEAMRVDHVERYIGERPDEQDVEQQQIEQKIQQMMEQQAMQQQAMAGGAVDPMGIPADMPGGNGAGPDPLAGLITQASGGAA